MRRELNVANQSVSAARLALAKAGETIVSGGMPPDLQRLRHRLKGSVHHVRRVKQKLNVFRDVVSKSQKVLDGISPDNSNRTALFKDIVQSVLVERGGTVEIALRRPFKEEHSEVSEDARI